MNYIYIKIEKVAEGG